MNYKIVLEFNNAEDLESFIHDTAVHMCILSKVRSPQLKDVQLKWKRGKRPRFTEWEAQVIRDHWGKRSAKTIAAMLGRTPMSIHQFVYKARKQGATFATIRHHHQHIIEQ